VRVVTVTPASASVVGKKRWPTHARCGGARRNKRGSSGAGSGQRAAGSGRRAAGSGGDADVGMNMGDASKRGALTFGMSLFENDPQKKKKNGTPLPSGWASQITTHEKKMR
jgi:hypothetical protein